MPLVDTMAFYGTVACLSLLSHSSARWAFRSSQDVPRPRKLHNDTGKVERQAASFNTRSSTGWTLQKALDDANTTQTPNIHVSVTICSWVSKIKVHILRMAVLTATMHSFGASPHGKHVWSICQEFSIANYSKACLQGHYSGLTHQPK